MEDICEDGDVWSSGRRFFLSVRSWVKHLDLRLFRKIRSKKKWYFLKDEVVGFRKSSFQSEKGVHQRRRADGATRFRQNLGRLKNKMIFLGS